MQLIFYSLDTEFKFKILTSTPLRADSIYIPIPRVGDSVNFDYMRHGKAIYEVVDIEYVFHPTADAKVECRVVKVFLHAKPSSMASSAA